MFISAQPARVALGPTTEGASIFTLFPCIGHANYCRRLYPAIIGQGAFPRERRPACGKGPQEGNAG
eukprot:4177482-Pleurochrysis_carterae.AAC.1